MERGTIVNKRIVKNPRFLIPMLSLAFLLILLAFTFNAQPVYAGDSGKLVAPQTQDPGEGGGHDDLFHPNTPHLIEGQIWIWGTGEYYANKIVHLSIPGDVTNTTDSRGYFQFSFPHPQWPDSWNIDPNHDYMISINGKYYEMGNNVEYPQYCQWIGYFHTDSIYAYATRTIHLQPAATVIVPAAALYSNTKYATLYYGYQTLTSFSHSLSFTCSLGAASTGYTTTGAVQTIFQTQPLLSFYIGRPFYGLAYWADPGFYPNSPTISGIPKAGIGDPTPHFWWRAFSTNEYLQPNSSSVLSNCYDITVPYGVKQTLTYEETDSYTWSASAGCPFGIVFQAFGIPIDMDVTVAYSSSSGTTRTVTIELDRMYDSNHSDVTFRLYTAGKKLDLDGGTGGMELHVWDVSGAG